MNYNLANQNFNFNQMKPKPMQPQQQQQSKLQQSQFSPFFNEQNSESHILRKMGSDKLKPLNQIKNLNENPNQKSKPLLNINSLTLSQLNDKFHSAPNTAYPSDFTGFNSNLGSSLNPFVTGESYFSDNNFRFNTFAPNGVSSLQQSTSSLNANDTVSFASISMLNANIEESNSIEKNLMKSSLNCASFLVGNENLNLNNNFTIGSSNSNSNLINTSNLLMASKESLERKMEIHSQTKSNIECSKQLDKKEQVNKMDKQDIRDKLSTILTKDQIDKVLQEHENETDIEKLIFLAGEQSFDF